MINTKQKLSILQDIFAICRLNKEDQIPDWALTGSFVSITRTSEELSVVAPQSILPKEDICDRGWRCLKIEGPLDLSLFGVLVSLIAPLAYASISIFAVATFDTDYFLVQEKDIEKAIEILSQEGHQVSYNEV